MNSPVPDQDLRDLQQANRRLAALTEFNLHLASEHDPQRLLDNVCRGARTLFGARWAALAVEGGDPHAQMHSYCGFDSSMVSGLPRPLVTGGPLRGELSQRLQIADGNPQSAGFPAGYPPVHALLVAPLASLSRHYGWIALVDKLGAHEFTREDEQLFTILAAQVGRVYENGTLYAESRRHAEALQTEIAERKRAEMRVLRLNRVHEVLSSINSLIVRVRDRETLFEQACRIAIEAGGFARAWIGMRMPDSDRILLVAAHGFEPGFLERAREGALLAPDDSAGTISRRAVREGRPLYANDLELERGRGLYQFHTDYGARAVAALPLMVAHEVVGVFGISSTEVDFFDPDECALLEELAGDIAFAVDHLAKVARLDYLAWYDDLTGLLNRSMFLDRIAQQLRNADDAHPLAVVLLDIDRFRSVNESLGRHAGDEVLRLAGKRIVETGIGSDAARVGPDLLAVLLRNAHEPEGVGLEVERLLDACFAAPFEVGGPGIRISARAGVALYPADGIEAETLFRNAEAALKRAKTGSGRMLFYAPEMNRRVAEALRLESRLRTALEHGQFVLHYQPKFDLATGKLCGAEALIRWNDAQHGIVAPGEFIPLLEETGMICDVGRWALEQACRDGMDWLGDGLAPVRIAVNVSPQQLRHRGFVDEIARLLGNDRQLGERLELEITESLLMEDVARTAQSLQSIRAMGVSIAVDDFGTGYSSLSHLCRLPVDKIKIDRSFVTDMVEHPRELTLVATIIRLAHSLELAVIAEGVETEEQARLLRSLRCDQLQGYLFGRPVPANVFREQVLKS